MKELTYLSACRSGSRHPASGPIAHGGLATTMLETPLLLSWDDQRQADVTFPVERSQRTSTSAAIAIGEVIVQIEAGAAGQAVRRVPRRAGACGLGRSPVSTT
jgi:hypothetical protein